LNSPHFAAKPLNTHLAVGILVWLLLGLPSSYAHAGGFEIPENTTTALARGGTGVASKRDPSAIYFNPALLSRTKGLQITSDLNLPQLLVRFQRDALVYRTSQGEEVRQDFAPVTNQSGPGPVPFLAAAYDFNVPGFGVALGAYGPHAYGNRCYTEVKDGNCVFDSSNGARHMMVSSQLLQIYFSAGVGYETALAGGQMSFGLTLSAAHQLSNFNLVADELFPTSKPWEEDPENQAPLRVADVSGWAPSGVIGWAYEIETGDSGDECSAGTSCGRRTMRFGASYRPPIYWESSGTYSLEFPDRIPGSPRLTDNSIGFRTWQAGSLRLGWNYELGAHPGDQERPLFDTEVNFVWEDWSRLEYFELSPGGELELDFTTLQLNPIYQPKGYQDTYSLRLGMSFGVLPWMTIHGGAFLETPAQRNTTTNVDFISWERYAGTLGATTHLTSWLDLSIAYAYVASPARQVDDGSVYNQIPLSGCTGPDYDDTYTDEETGETQNLCDAPGVPPGNPQNNGAWSSSFHIASVGLNWKFD
jgi:long-subunit fatty acid transport protein